MKKIAYIDNFDKWLNEFTFSIQVTIRFSETDMFGHMNNVSPFIYLEQARIEFLKASGILFENSENNGVPVVGDLQCDYHKQLYFDENIRVYVKAQSIGTTSTDLHYMVVNEKEDVCLTARGRLVFINAATGIPVPLSVEMKDKLHYL